jgi:hypothetical protein
MCPWENFSKLFEKQLLGIQNDSNTTISGGKFPIYGDLAGTKYQEPGGMRKEGPSSG